jgi:hypothetical protein
MMKHELINYLLTIVISLTKTNLEPEWIVTSLTLFLFLEANNLLEKDFVKKFLAEKYLLARSRCKSVSFRLLINFFIFLFKKTLKKNYFSPEKKKKKIIKKKILKKKNQI